MPPIDIGNDKQLFVGPWDEDGRDTHLVESMRDIEMTMNPAHVTGEKLMVNDRPWEGTGMLDMRQFVLRDGDRFRMYYSAGPYHFISNDHTDPRHNLWKRPHRRILCYAESDDGLHWTKPSLGLCEFNGSRDNNILLPNDEFDYLFSEVEGACPFLDPAAKSPDEKYKMFIKIAPVAESGSDDEADGLTPVKGAKSLPKGQYAFASPDGIHWRLMSEKKVNPGPHDDTQYSVFWDPRIGKYVQYSRAKTENPKQVEYYKHRYADLPDAQGVRWRSRDLYVGRAVSDDFINWTEEEIVFGPDELDRANSPEGLTRLDYYAGNVSRYSETSNIYIGLPNAYGHWKYDTTQKWWGGGGSYVQLPSTMDVQLITSRDGIQWNRAPKRRSFIALGPEGSFWSRQVYPDGNAFRVGDELWFYFAGLDVHHQEQSLRASHGARGRAMLRLDGFISADSAYTGGELTTRPLTFAGSKLRLNVATGAGGTVRVEMLDPEGGVIEGFTLADADEINGNHMRVDASWRGSTDVGVLAGRPVKLRFVMRDAKLYSFEFVDP